MTVNDLEVNLLLYRPCYAYCYKTADHAVLTTV